MITSIALALLMSPIAQAERPEVVSRGDSDDWCLRCHGMSTLAVRREDGAIRNLAVAAHAFSQSNHRRLDCVDCHNDDATRYPHGEGAAMAVTCTECHARPDHALTRDNPLAAMHFAEIGQEFERSIHKRRLGDEFTCFSCHNPHQFRKSEDPSLQTISAQNGICLTCHDSDVRFTTRTERPRPDLDAAHQWLPNRALHWEHVRCLDCHTSYDPPNRSHLVLAAKSAVQKCEDCHSQNSVLLDKLYRHRHAEELERSGFANAALFNDSYVIGATRNTVLDVVGLIVVGGALLGVVLHGVLRGAARRRDD